MNQDAWAQLNLAAFPLAWWPVHVFAAAVDGYFEAFFAVMTPPGSDL